MNIMQTIVLNTDQFPIKERHIGFRACSNLSENTISLYQIFEASYPHPEAPQDAIISRLEERHIKTEKINSARGAAIHLVDMADKNAQNQFRTI